MPTIVMGKSPKPEQSKSFTPTAEGSVITPDAGYTLSQVTVSGDPGLYPTNIRGGTSIFGVAGDPNVVNTIEANATPDKILNGANAYAGGMNIVGTIPSKGAQTYTPGTSDQTITSGQYLSGTQTISGNANLVSNNIRSGISIFGVSGATAVVNTSDATAVAGDIASGKTAYINGSKITGTNVSPLAAGTGTLLASTNTNNINTQNYNYVKVREITVNFAGTYTVNFETGVIGNDVGGRGRIYVNGVARGTERSWTNTQSFSENITVNAGDKIQLYHKLWYLYTENDYSYVRGLKIYVNTLYTINM